MIEALKTDPTSMRKCILVLGMHRSGTSALTRMISLLGTGLPRQVLPANKSNELGHWEPARIVELHDRVLAELNSSWISYREIDLQQLSAERHDLYVRQLSDTISTEFAGHDAFVLKDPRVCRLLPLMRDALDRLKLQSVCVVIYRNPFEVASSLQRRDGMPLTHGYLLWLRYTLDAERHSRGERRIFVSHKALMTNPQSVVDQLTSKLDLCRENQNADAAPADSHIDPAHWHHKLVEPDTDSQLGGLGSLLSSTLTAHEELSADPNSHSAQSSLDSVHEALSASLDILGPVLGEKEKILDEQSIQIQQQSRSVDLLEDRTSTLEKSLVRAERRYEASLKKIFASTSWRLTSPIRACGRIVERFR